MNNNETSKHDDLITRWIDGELSDAEVTKFEHRLESDAAFAAEVESATSSSKELGDLLRSEFPSNIEPPSPELFNVRIMNHLEQTSSAQEKNVIQPAASIWSRMPWLIAAAAVIMAAFIVLRDKPGDTSSAMIAASEVSNTYAPRLGVEIRTRFVADAGATVVSLEGLEEIPSSHEIEGELVASYLPTAPSNAPVFASAESGEPVFVLLRDAYNVPSVVRLPRD